MKTTTEVKRYKTICMKETWVQGEKKNKTKVLGGKKPDMPNPDKEKAEQEEEKFLFFINGSCNIGLTNQGD